MVIAQFAFARTVYLFAHRPLSVVALEYASTLQFRNDQVHEIDKAFRAYSVCEVKAINAGVPYPAFELICDCLRPTYEHGPDATDPDKLCNSRTVHTRSGSAMVNPSTMDWIASLSTYLIGASRSY